jgi:hypothetical protein
VSHNNFPNGLHKACNITCAYFYGWTEVEYYHDIGVSLAPYPGPERSVEDLGGWNMY